MKRRSCSKKIGEDFPRSQAKRASVSLCCITFHAFRPNVSVQKAELIRKQGLENTCFVARKDGCV